MSTWLNGLQLKPWLLPEAILFAVAVGCLSDSNLALEDII